MAREVLFSRVSVDAVVGDSPEGNAMSGETYLKLAKDNGYKFPYEWPKP